MRLARFAIKNYKGIDNIEIFMPTRNAERPGSGDFLSIVGQNNSSKSSILEALDLALSGERAVQADEFHNHNLDNPIEVELEFSELSDADRKLRAVSSHIFNNTYTVKKVWKKPGSRPERFVREPNYEYEDFPADGKREDYLSNVKWQKAVNIYESESKTLFKPLKKSQDELKRIARENNLNAARQASKPVWNEDTAKEDDWKRSNEEYKPNPGGWASNLASAIPRTIYIPAIQQTNEISDPAKKQSAIRKILIEIFENRLNQTNEMARLKSALADMARLFEDDQRGAIVSEIERGISQEVQRIIDIEAKLSLVPASIKELCTDLIGRTELRLRDRSFGPSTRPEHQGHGAQRALVLCLLQILAEQMYQRDLTHQSSLLLLVEEPEIYLHPEMCRRMRDTLLTIAQNGRAQVICTTHSPIFLDLADRHDGIVILRRQASKLELVQKSEDVFGLKKEQKDRLRMLMSFDPTVNEIFFSEEVCLVEGETEIASIEAIANKIIEEEKDAIKAMELREKYQQRRRKVAMINCRGKTTIPAFQRVLNHFGIKYRVMHDGDLQSDDFVPTSPTEKGASTNNSNIAELLPAENRDVRLRVHYPFFEHQVLGYTPKDKDKAWQAISKLNDATISPEILRFFEFSLGITLAQLCSRPAEAALPDDDTERPSSHSVLRRNSRDKIQRIPVPTAVRRRKLSFHEAIGIAAGQGRIFDFSTDGYQGIDGMGDSFVAQVVGSSMEDTLQNGDKVLMRKVDVELPAIALDQNSDLTHFLSRVKSDGIYVLAINQDIEERAYTIKRVRIDARSDGSWLCRIMADNPACGWGDPGGSRVVRKTDRVHFAAELVGFPFEADRSVEADGMSPVEHMALV